MTKKILIIVGILAVVGVIFVIGGLYKAGNQMTAEFEKREPEFRQYITMTVEEQNAYVSENINEVYSSILKLAGVSDEEMAALLNTLEELDKIPEVKQAKINWGRSAVARFILDIENIRKDLSEDVLKQLQAESDEYENRLSEYKKQINLNKPAQK